MKRFLDEKEHNQVRKSDLSFNLEENLALSSCRTPTITIVWNLIITTVASKVIVVATKSRVHPAIVVSIAIVIRITIWIVAVILCI